MQTALINVRFEGNNGHDADATRCLLMTQSGHFTLFCHLQDRKAGTSEASYLISGSPASTAVSGVEVLRQPGEKELVAEGQDDSAYKEADDSCTEKAADGTHEDDQHGHIDAATQ